MACRGSAVRVRLAPLNFHSNRNRLERLLHFKLIELYELKATDITKSQKDYRNNIFNCNEQKNKS